MQRDFLYKNFIFIDVPRRFVVMYPRAGDGLFVTDGAGEGRGGSIAGSVCMKKSVRKYL
jgi:hypothetical protein